MQRESDLKLITVRIDKPEVVNFILGQTHFIKSVGDIHEAPFLLRKILGTAIDKAKSRNEHHVYWAAAKKSAWAFAP